MKYEESHRTVSEFLSKCEKEKLPLPENPYEAMMEVNMALKTTHGKEQEAMAHLKKKFTGNNKRSHGQAEEPQGESGGEEEMPHHKRVKLAEEIQAESARCPENQKLVDAFIEYGLTQLDQGHTGKGSIHLRAAREIRNHDKVIKDAFDAKQVGFVGDRMAGQVEQILKQGKIIDEGGALNVSKDYKHNPPHIVHEIRDTPAKRPENQKLVNALTDFAEHELEYGNTGKGTSHLRAAREIHNADVVITSGFQATQSVGFIGEVIADKIDQILKHGKVVRDEGGHYDGKGGPKRVRGDIAPIVRDLLENPAKCPENQKIVDQLRDYGDAHLSSGHRGKGISHLRAAKSIRDSDVVIKEAQDAMRIGMVGKNVIHKVDQIMRQGHADDDSDYEEGSEEGYEEVEAVEEEPAGYYGSTTSRRKGTDAPIVHEIRSAKATNAANQKLVDALTDFGEKQLKEVHTGRGITYLRAARELRNSTEAITSRAHAKKIAVVGNKVASFIDQVLAKSKQSQLIL